MNFNKSDGRHLSYREFEQLSAEYTKLNSWALDNAKQIISKDTCFKYVATSKKGQISIGNFTNVKKGWDGRYINTLSVWAITTFLLWRYRDKVLSGRFFLRENIESK